jgi:hypothetical protein
MLERESPRFLASVAEPVFRSAVKALVPKWLWMLIGKWLIRILVLAAESLLFARRSTASGLMTPPIQELGDYSQEILAAIAEVADAGSNQTRGT